MLQGHAVTLTFNVATQMLCATCRPNMVTIFVKYVSKSDFKLQSYGPDTILLQGRAVTLTFKEGTQILHATSRLNMVVISVK